MFRKKDENIGVGRSMAVWYTKAADHTSHAEADYHFNLWHYKHSSFLDIGIWLHQPMQIKDISIYLPFSTKVRPVDLGNKLAEHETVIGIFNESVTTSVGDKKWVEIKFAENRTKLRVYSLSDEEIIVEEAYGGTIVTLNEDAIRRARTDLQDNDLYFRFRIVLPRTGNPFVNDSGHLDSVFSTGHDVLRFFDFRFNELRNLPAGVARLIGDDAKSKFTVRQIHFLLATEVRCEYIDGYQPFHKCRMLEKDKWDSYIDTPNIEPLPENMVIYHWKRPNKVQAAKTQQPQLALPLPSSLYDFNAFLKFRIRKCNWWTIVIYVLVVLLLSYAANNIPLFERCWVLSCEADTPVLTEAAPTKGE